MILEYSNYYNLNGYALAQRLKTNGQISNWCKTYNPLTTINASPGPYFNNFLMQMHNQVFTHYRILTSKMAQ